MKWLKYSLPLPEKQQISVISNMSSALGTLACCLSVSGHCVVLCMSLLSVALCLDGILFHPVYLSGEDGNTVLDVS